MFSFVWRQWYKDNCVICESPFTCFVDQETVSEGPVPLCSANSVSFVAEQVSHHPPSKYLIILGCSVVEAFSLMCELTLNAAFLPEMRISCVLSAVSAFYAECLSKKIQFNAHIWTKSKFLGMSIGVHNIGQGIQVTPSYASTHRTF